MIFDPAKDGVVGFLNNSSFIVVLSFCDQDPLKLVSLLMSTLFVSRNSTQGRFRNCEGVDHRVLVRVEVIV